VGEAYQRVVARTRRESAREAIEALEARNARLRDRIAEGAAATEGSGLELAAQAEREAAITQLVNNGSQIEQLMVNAKLFGSGVQNFAPAGVPGAPSSSSPLRPTAIGLVLGAALGAGAAYRMAMTRGVDNGDEAARILGVPMLGELPEMSGSNHRSGIVPTLSAPLSAEAEAYHYVAAALELSLRELTGTTILVTSLAPRDGKTITALNLAIALARDGMPVLLVDADERQRGLSQLVDTGQKTGLRELIRGDTPIEECMQYYHIRDGMGLQMIAAAPQVTEPAAFYRTRGLGRALERLKETGQVVLIDSPPLSVSETSTMAGQSDAVMLLVSRGTSPRDLRRALHRLDLVGASVSGFVFNRAKVEGPRVGYGRSRASSTLRTDTVRDTRATPSTNGNAGESSHNGDDVLSSGPWEHRE
jgi:Mrp family chromosome partitioning ATPase